MDGASATKPGAEAGSPINCAMGCDSDAMMAVAARPVHNRMRRVFFNINFAPARSPETRRSDTILEIAVGSPAEDSTSRKL